MDRTKPDRLNRPRPTDDLSLCGTHTDMSRHERIADGLLLLRCQQGDGEAFAELVRRWQARLFRHACRMTGEREAAADVVQESWLAVLKGLPRLADVDAFPKWVYTVVTNRSADWVRKRQRQRRLTAAWTEKQQEAANDASRTRAAPSSLADALEPLNTRERGLITLYYIEGFSTEEIADILSIPRGTVKSRLHAARAKIRAQMEDDGHGQRQR